MRNHEDIVKYYLLNDEIVKAIFPNRTKIAEYILRKENLDLPVESFRQKVAQVIKGIDFELVREVNNSNKRAQKYQDKNRVHNKVKREHFRLENTVEEYAKSIKGLLKEQAKELSKIVIPKISVVDKEYVGVIHIGDWHCNELIDLPQNKYDFTVAAKRAKKLADTAIKIFTAAGIKKIVFISVGDMLNSDRRLDELLNQSTNRAKATLLTVHILKQMLIHLRQHFIIDVFAVLGNESRVSPEMSFSNSAMSDNYDFTIFANLKDLFSFAGIDGINFKSIDKMEEIIDICGKKWLITHDYNKGTSKQKDVQATMGRYSLSGHLISYVLGGHIHATRTTDISSRCSSLAGTNSYNEVALNLSGRASQMLYLVDKDNIHKIAVDLQNTDGIDGYEIIKELEAYHAKSLSKTHKQITIHKVTV